MVNLEVDPADCRRPVPDKNEVSFDMERYFLNSRHCQGLYPPCLRQVSDQPGSFPHFVWDMSAISQGSFSHMETRLKIGRRPVGDRFNILVWDMSTAISWGLLFLI